MTFDALTKSHVTATPRWDQANRTIVCIDYVFDIRNHTQNNGSSIDSLMESWREILLTPAGEFKYTGKGFGNNLSVGPGGPLDVSFGPRPLNLEFTPIGDLAAITDYKIQVSIPECTGNVAYQKKLMALNYSADYSVDAEGLTSRTITGYAQIPMIRPFGARSLSDVADNYRDQVTPAMLTGFRRETQDFKISDDKSRIDFTIVDKQLPYALPAGVSHCECTHKISSGLMKKGFNIWDGSISAKITLPKPSQGLGKGETWQKFLLIVGSLLKADNLKGLPPVKNVAAGGGTFLPTSLEIENEVFTNSSHFTLEFQIIGVNLAGILAASGLWRPITNCTFDGWKASMAQVTGSRGTAGLKLNANDDLIIDLCQSTTNILRGPGAQDPPKPNGDQQGAQGGDVAAPGKAWVRYENQFRLEEDDRVVRQKPLNTAKGVTMAIGPNPLNFVIDAEKAQGGAPAGVQSKLSDKYQRVTSPSVRLIMEGYGVRLQQKTPVPRLVSYAGQTPVQLSQKSGSYVIGAILTQKLYCTWWQIVYLLPQPPDAEGESANPTYGTDGEKS